MRWGGEPLNRVAVELDASVGRPEQTDQRLHERRLTDAVATEQGQNLALAELAVDAGQHRDGAVGRVQVADLEHGYCRPR